VVTDAGGAVHDVNLEAARMFGLPRSKLGGRRLHTFLGDEHWPALAELLESVFAAGAEDTQARTCDVALCADGAEVRLVAWARSAAEPRALVAMHDVSARKRAERALRDESIRKDEFMAALSHELRNPLTPIRSSLAVLARAEPGGGDARGALVIAERQLDHLVHIVDDLLDVTRIVQGKIRLAREPVELGRLLRSLVDDHRRDLESRGIALDTSMEPEMLWVDADRTRLAQVVGNLLGNALKFTPRGGHVEVASRREGDRAVLTVRDDGAGIAPDMREHLFQPFVQAPQTLERTPGGLGLGLAMVKGLVELHGGTVEASSAGLGCGSLFTVSLPLAQAPAARTPAPRSHVGRSAEARPAPRRILLIDDNADSADAMASLLELMGHEVLAAYDGRAGLELASGFRPDVVFCDLGLPEMDGFAVARAMRADVAIAGVYLVALSGYARADDRRRSAEAGFDLHLAKPPSLDQVERVLAEPPSRSS
jgi:two-component system CheB/CheR fusion protein